MNKLNMPSSEGQIGIKQKNIVWQAIDFFASSSFALAQK